MDMELKELIHKFALEIHRCKCECHSMHKGIMAILANENFLDKMRKLGTNNIHVGGWYDMKTTPFTYVDGNHKTCEEYNLATIDEIEEWLTSDYHNIVNQKTDIDSINWLKERVLYARRCLEDYKVFCANIGNTVALVEQKYNELNAAYSAAVKSIIEELNI